MFPLPSLFWCVVQVSLVASVSLALCWTLRGARPQFTTAMLSGSAMVSLLLGGLACLPSTHWSLRNEITSSWTTSAVPPIDAATKPNKDFDALGISSPRTSIDTSDADSDKFISYESEAKGYPLPATILHWLLSNVQSIDEGVRGAERSSFVDQSTWLARVPWILGLGVGLMTGLWLHGWLWMRWMVRKSESLSSEALETRIHRISKQMKLRRTPALRISDRVPIGATVGVFRPVLLLNRHWQRWTDHELEAVLLHESAHIARHDFFWVVIGSWLRVLYFFHPLMHLLVRRWRMEQELAADQLAAGWMSDARAYGRALASLALRAECSVRTPSPVLSAEQICVIRRITMLKQGQLVPRRHGWRWAAAITFLTVVMCVPLTGLRGTPPDDKPMDADQVTREDVQAIQARSQQLQEIQEKCPPLQLHGKMIWNPGRFQSADFDHGMRYINQALTFAFLGSLSEDAAIHGRSHIALHWSDLEKVHGSVSIGADVSEGDQVNPKVLSHLITHPSLGGLRQSNQVKLIEGRQASAMTRQVFVPETGSYKESDPVSWVVDDEQGFLHGTEAEIVERLQGKSDPFATIPAELLEQYRTAAFATVFTECTTWMKHVEHHFEGSRVQDQVVLVYPMFDGLKHLGFFLVSSDDRDCIVRAIYSNFENAQKAK
ncbi:MAG: M56 family metallopeptidase, partial [Pirellula sp.]|nr:M56 family metallopeptidase [Pirellula sp.]